MWVVLGFVIAVSIGVVTVLLLCPRRTAHLADHPWILNEAAKGHVGIMAVLAGFAFTGLVL